MPPSNYIAGFLRAFPGKVFCHDCLVFMIGMPAQDVRASSTKLRTEDGFQVTEARCFNCDKPGPTVGYTPPPK